MSTDVFEIRIGQNVATFNSFVNARYSDISVDCNDFEAGFLITYRKIKFYTAKINDIWTKNEINNNKCQQMFLKSGLVKM
jgi:hypothetical protein